MLKPPEKLKEHDLEMQFEAALRTLMARVPFLKLTSLQKDVRLSPERPEQVDRLARLVAGDREWTLVVEEKRMGQPRQVRAAVLQLERYLSRLPAGELRYGVVVAPFISEDSARICIEAGLGYADLVGNARLCFDQVFIETRAAENPFREHREARSLFGLKATRVLRRLLQGPLRPWRVVELAEAAQVSLGWVSAVRQQLLAREWAVEEAGGFRLVKPGVLLDGWAAADRWEHRTTVRQYSLLVTEPREMASRLQDFLGESQHAFTQWFAGWLRHPYTLPPVVTAYVGRFPDEVVLGKRLLARRVPQGGRLWLVEPRDEGVFQPVQVVDGFLLAPDVQIYLDLRHAGQRGEEQAAELRKWPDFAGSWA